ncbi:MAG: DUF2948 family protein [Alphaproteobacteria bacterium]|nr:DUF2948 family protein [Alphaproteobacteria bacterium]
MSERLQLRAVDADDLSILGAYLQDALVPVSDMCFLSAENRFVLVANRFRWEKLEAPDGDASQDRASAKPAGEPGETYERVHCGITFEHVKRVKSLGFAPGAAVDQGRLLEVLTIINEDNDVANEITMVFSGNTAVKLEVDAVEVFVQDLGEPWPTMWRPHHPVEEGPDQEEGPEPEDASG